MSFHSKGHIFHLKHCVYFSILVRIFVGTLDSCFLTHRKHNTTSIHVTLFKNMSKCVFTCIHIKLLTDSVNKVHFGGKYICTAKKSWQGGHFFRTLVRRVWGAYAPAGDQGQRPRHFILAFQGSQLSLCSTNGPSKGEWKNTAFWKGKFTSYLGKVRVFFYQHCFPKVIDTYCRHEKHGKQLSINTIGNKRHTLVTENTPYCDIKFRKE